MGGREPVAAGFPPADHHLKKKCPECTPPKIAFVSAIFALMNECPTRVRTGVPPCSVTISGTALEVIRL